jgi:predicted HTH transcriptional regulator
VREQNLDLTSWLEYFTEGLATQLAEVQHKGELLIRQDVLALKYGLSERQKAAVGLALRQPAFGIQDLEALLPGVHRRTLQRELKELLDQGVFVATGATRNLSYSLAK